MCVILVLMTFVSNGVKKLVESFTSLGIVSMPLAFYITTFFRPLISVSLTVLKENLSLSETSDPLTTCLIFIMLLYFFLNPADKFQDASGASCHTALICKCPTCSHMSYLSPISPPNGLVSLLVCSRWCAGHEILWERVLLEKKVDMKCMLVNVLKNTARRLISCLVMSHACFRVNLHSVVSWMSRNSLLETDPISEV